MLAWSVTLPLASGAAAAPTSFLNSPLILMGILFAIFYVMLIWPMRKKQRKHAEMLAALKNGDKIITNGGIYGTVVGVTDDKVQVRIAKEIKIDLSRNAVAALQHQDS